MITWHAFQDGEIFGKAGNWVEYALREYWSKPVVNCSVCMAPWWGSLYYLILWGADRNWPVVVLCSAGLNAIIVRLWPPKD